jgi:hypothetical protein
VAWEELTVSFAVRKHTYEMLGLPVLKIMRNISCLNQIFTYLLLDSTVLFSVKIKKLIKCGPLGILVYFTRDPHAPLLFCCSTLKMETTCSSETLVDIQRTTERYIPERKITLFQEELVFFILRK